MKIFIKLISIIFLTAAILITSVFGLSYFAYYEAKEEMPVDDVYEYVIDETSTYTYFDDIDDDLKNAFVAVEDRRFYERRGIDFISLARATITNLYTKSLKEGGSTITQQLIKNVYYGYNHSFFEKFAEYFFIYDFEDVYTHDEILEMYINYNNYGDGNFNIYDACKNYFNKDTDDLTIYEASLLAGIVNSPANYELSKNNPNTYKRQRHVLKCMLEEGYINQDEYNNALSLQP